MTKYSIENFLRSVFKIICLFLFHVHSCFVYVKVSDPLKLKLGSYELLCRCWELNLVTLEQQPVLSSCWVISPAPPLRISRWWILPSLDQLAVKGMTRYFSDCGVHIWFRVFQHRTSKQEHLLQFLTWISLGLCIWIVIMSDSITIKTWDEMEWPLLLAHSRFLAKDSYKPYMLFWYMDCQLDLRLES